MSILLKIKEGSTPIIFDFEKFEILTYLGSNKLLVNVLEPEENKGIHVIYASEFKVGKLDNIELGEKEKEEAKA